MEAIFKELREKKHILVAEKKATVKHTDVMFITSTGEGSAEKSESELDSLKLKLVLNTTNVMDSHDDVHMVGIWNKTLKENKQFYLLQEHKMQFDKIISSDAKAYTSTMQWSDLGADFVGETQALIFDVEISKDRNPYMFNQYAKGYVNNHSVGMQYVKIALAMNSDSKYDEEEKKNWDKYINEVANKEQAMQRGYFFAVTEAKLIEGSAVPIGSNRITPVLSETKDEPIDVTHQQYIEPTKSLKQKMF